MAKELRDLLKSQNLDTVLASSFKQVGGAVFPDRKAASDLDDFVQVIQSYRGVHSPTFGVPIPMSGAVSTVDGTGTLLAPSKTEVCLIEAISLNNSGAAPIEVLIKIGDVGVTLVVSNPSADTPVSISSKYTSYNLPVTVTVISGTAADLTTTCAYQLVCQ